VVPNGSGSPFTVLAASAGTLAQSFTMRLLMSGSAALAKSLAPAVSVARSPHAGSAVLALLACAATWADLASSGWAAAGVDLLLCLVNPYKVPHDAVMQTIELMGKEVIPQFR